MLKNIGFCTDHSSVILSVLQISSGHWSSIT